jgi:predicted nuclease of predicted toxin-antitoxin system
MTFLIDECLHPSLVHVAELRGQQAFFVAHLGMQGWPDKDVVERALERDFVLVTNNAVDFRRLYERVALHAGLIIVVPQVSPEKQRLLFGAVLDEVGDRWLVNTVIEVMLEDQHITIAEYAWPAEQPE